MYGLIGFPLSHSFSAEFFNEKFKRENISETYSLFPIKDIKELPQLLKKYPDMKGLNVTIPYKQSVIPYLSEISEEAREIGAVNVIKIGMKGFVLKGFNTDVIGFRDSISPLLKPYMKNALVLGTGGASKAVAYMLEKAGLKVTKVSRQPAKGVITYSDLTREVMENNPVVVNTTPLGTWPNTDAAPDIPYEFATSGHLFFDLVYNPEITKFMRLAAAHGATVKNGLEMLHGQALAAWKIWGGK